MKSIYKMRNPIQPYAWGSRRSLAEFQNRPWPSAGPEAELWMGAHPKAPSHIHTRAGWTRLEEAIRVSPGPFLGSRVLSRFGPQLPFLFKVLAVDQPLSLQAHPDKRRAVEGYRRENAQGLPLDAPHRNYKDENHKPECICALTPFWALCGFRQPHDAARLLEPLWPSRQRRRLGLLAQGWRAFYEFLATQGTEWQQRLSAHAAEHAARLTETAAEFEWIDRLHRHYPGDLGVLAPALLNLIRLSPGQALFLPAGQLHAYLGGMGIEIMANSDNVLRGGLTTKHIDVAELISVLDFRPLELHILTPQGADERVYPSAAAEFRLSRIVGAEKGALPFSSGGPEIILCTRGKARIAGEAGEEIDLLKGESVFIPAATERYFLSGEAELFRAAVNDSQ